MLYGDLWLRHNSTNLSLHLSVLTNVFFLAGLVFWFGPRWKYFRLTMAIALLVVSPIGAFHYISDKHIFGVVLCAFWFLSGIFQSNEEVAKLKLLSKSQKIENQLKE
jgi:hypothetical protein